MCDHDEIYKLVVGRAGISFGGVRWRRSFEAVGLARTWCYFIIYTTDMVRVAQEEGSSFLSCLEKDRKGWELGA